MLDPHTEQRVNEALSADESFPAVKAFLSNPLNPEVISEMEDVVVRVALLVDGDIEELMSYIFSVLPTL